MPLISRPKVAKTLPKELGPHLGNCAVFRSQMRSQHNKQQVQQPRRLTAVTRDLRRLETRA
jgi:hypothetical protein